MSALPPAPPMKLPNLGPTFGVVYLGIVISAMLYGVTCLQTLVYFMSATAKKDPVWVKLLVVATLVLDTAHEGVLMHVGYFYFVKNFFNPLALQFGEWSIVSHIFFQGAAAFMVECFMIWRLHILCRRNFFLTGPAMILVVGHLGVHWSWPIQALTGPDLSFDRIKDLTATAIARCVIGSTTDVYIAASLSFFLYKSRTNFKKSNDMITKLIQYIITTGLLTTVDDFITMAVYVARPLEFYHMFFSAMLPKLYINSLLATLNSREFIRHKNDIISIHMSGIDASRAHTGTTVTVTGGGGGDVYSEPPSERASTMQVHVNTMKFSDDSLKVDSNNAIYNKPSSFGPY